MSSSALPTLSSAQVREVDTLCEERFGISVDWLMEAAGWQVARFCDEPSVVVCGVGNNAGDGLAAARHLHNWGRLTAVCCVDPDRLRGAAAQELAALRLDGVEVLTGLRLTRGRLVVDALLGTGLTRAPEGKIAEWIEAINLSGARVVAIDLPSGLDADTGLAYSPTVRADVTVTLGLPKPGLTKGHGPTVAGQLWVADIGIPPSAYATLGIEAPVDLFATNDRVRIA